MSHLSRQRKTQLLAGAVLATACAMPSMSQAAPLIQISMVGKDITRGDTNFVSDLGAGVNVGDTISYQIKLLMVTGVSNAVAVSGSNPTGTIASLDQNGGDGVNSLYFDYKQATGDAIQGSIVNSGRSGTKTVAPFNWGIDMNGPFAWESGSGASGGDAVNRGNGNNDLLNVRPVGTPGVFYASNYYNTSDVNEALVIGTGTFVVTSKAGEGLSQFAGSWKVGGEGGFKINSAGTGQELFITSATEGGADPIVSFAPLTMGEAVVPEPGSLTLLGLASAGLLLRRKNKA